MDDSISKALIMVAGMLLAIIVIAFITFSFRKMSSWAETSDEKQLAEQRDEFNKEYEVYDKKLMYGVDVISCLNKAYSNNQRINDGKFVNGETYDNSYEVQVEVKLKSQLQESITVYYVDEESKKELAYPQQDGPGGEKLGDPNTQFSFLKDDDSNSYKNKISNFEENQNLETKTQACKIKTEGKDFILTKEKNPAEDSPEAKLRALLSVSDTLSEVIKNPNKNEANKWSKAEFRSALYDLKTKKFKCNGIQYNAETGRVNYIEFQEY